MMSSCLEGIITQATVNKYLTVDEDYCTIRERELCGVELMETIWQEGRFLKEVTLSDLRKV